MAADSDRDLDNAPALLGMPTCICKIIAESAKQINSVCVSVRACLEKGQVAADSDRDLGHASALPGMPSYLLNCL